MDKKDAHKAAKDILHDAFIDTDYGVIAELCGVPVETVMAWKDPDSEELPTLAQIVMASSHHRIGWTFYRSTWTKLPYANMSPNVIVDVAAHAVGVLQNLPLHTFDPGDKKYRYVSQKTLHLVERANALASNILLRAYILLEKAGQHDTP